MSVSDWSGSGLGWERELAALKGRLGPVFRRQEARESCGAFIDGLLSGIERKTGWLMAEQAGLERPWRIQALLGRSHWDCELMRSIVFDYVVEALADPSGVLVVDETGFLKKGRHSVGVGRQYSGTAGRIENCQVGVFAAYASRFGQALIDRRLYLPEAWARDAARRKAARRSMTPRDVAVMSIPFEKGLQDVRHLWPRSKPCHDSDCWVVTCPCGIGRGRSWYAWSISSGGT